MGLTFFCLSGGVTLSSLVSWWLHLMRFALSNYLKGHEKSFNGYQTAAGGDILLT